MLSKISITSPSISLPAIEDLVAEVKNLKADSTFVMVRAKKLRRVPLTIFTNVSTIVRIDLQEYFETELTQEGSLFQIKYKHLSSKK